jgi:hypothetical protein
MAPLRAAPTLAPAAGLRRLRRLLSMLMSSALSG